MDQLKHIASKNQLSLGLVFPIESYKGSIASMSGQENLAQRAEELGFKSLWFRDVPFNDPNFGDAGQMYDPWIYMSHMMNQTKEIALATGSIILPLRHPVHTAKSIMSLQSLSEGRIIMGIASGDRPIEYPAFNQDIEIRTELFQDNFFYLKALMGVYPIHHSKYYGHVPGSIDILPKQNHHTSFLVTGHSGQSLEWIAEHSDGWLYYPRDFKTLEIIMKRWNKALNETKQEWKPFIQSLYVDLLEDESAKPEPIHLGFKSGIKYLQTHLHWLKSYGVNHVILNLKYGSRPAGEVVEEIGEEIIPLL